MGSDDRRADRRVVRRADDLLRRALDRACASRRIPGSTYRLQFHAGFTFRDAAAVVPYLAGLGVTHVYASPYLQPRPAARTGTTSSTTTASTPNSAPKKTTSLFLAALARAGMSHVLDTVPNHVGVAGNDNVWWNDVLEHGPASRYAAYFDISWRGSPRPELRDRVLLPLLGEPYAKVLEQGQLTLAFDEERGRFEVRYYERRFPVSPCSYGLVLARRDRVAARAGADDRAVAEVESILTAVGHLPDRSERDLERFGRAPPRKRRDQAPPGGRRASQRGRARPRPVGGRGVQRVAGRRRAASTCSTRCSDGSVTGWLTGASRPTRSTTAGSSTSTTLAALAMERPEVFDAAHALTLHLAAEGKIDRPAHRPPRRAVRPPQYFQRLQRQYRPRRRGRTRVAGRGLSRRRLGQRSSRR